MKSASDCSTLAVALCLSVVACGSGDGKGNDGGSGGSAGSAGAAGSAGTEVVYPHPDWPTSTPSDESMDAAGLDAVAEIARTANSNCLLVTRHGRVVGEWYWNDWTATTEQGVFSVTKSFTSAVVGIASDRGELDVEEPASKYIEEWRDTESASVTIRHLLSNDSGRFWDFNTDYLTMAIQEMDKTQFSVELGQQHAPGTFWEYNNSAIQTLDRVLTRATGKDAAEYAKEHLLDPIGSGSSFSHDAAGNTLMFSDLNASCRDLARFGYLYLRGGKWANDVQVISPEWVEASTKPSQTLNAAYGYLWWLNQPGPYVLPSAPSRSEGTGPMIPGAPMGIYAALGLGSQIVGVDPGREIVFTRIGPADLSAGLAGSSLVVELAQAIDAAIVPDESSQ